ncbi:hypothetical protein BD770DRAFT_345611, partial [Pilaira anomala]
MNALILAKIWYSLRLLQPTKRFMNRLRSCIFQFIWKKKHPSLKKETIFLPWIHGGLQVLDPLIQHIVLQKRWLNYIFDPISYPSFAYPFILCHLSLFTKSSRCPLLPFYLPEYRKSAICDYNLSIWNSIFRTFDAIHPKPITTIPEIPLATLLDLPLYKIITPSDNNHWTTKHKTFLSGQFLIFDENQDRLRLRVTGEYPRYPRLCSQLYQDILQTRLVRLHPNVWPFITNGNSPQIDWSKHSLTTSVIGSNSWKYYSSKNLRQELQSASISPARFLSRTIKTFWTCPMFPNARTLYFRCFSNCIPTKKILFKYGVVPNSTCSLCGLSIDDKRHFLVECPI